MTVTISKSSLTLPGNEYSVLYEFNNEITSSPSVRIFNSDLFANNIAAKYIQIDDISPTSPTNSPLIYGTITWPSGTTDGKLIDLRVNDISQTTLGSLINISYQGNTIFNVNKYSEVSSSIYKPIGINRPFIAQPTGTGAFQLALADNTATGGNARGSRAIDLQLSRTLADRVASGTNSVAIGNNNRASGSNSFVLGVGNQISGTGALIGNSNNSVTGNNTYLIGTQNTSNASNSTLIGANNTSTGIEQYTTAIGYNNTVSGKYATAIGTGADTKGIQNIVSFSSPNRLQSSILNLNNIATDTTVTNLLSEDLNLGILPLVPTASNQLYLLPSTTVAFTILASARYEDALTQPCKCWEIKGGIKRGPTTTNIIGTPIITVIASDAGTESFNISVSANSTLGCLEVKFQTSTTPTLGLILCTCTIYTSESALPL